MCAPTPRPYHCQQVDRGSHRCAHAIVGLVVRASAVHATPPASPHTGGWPTPAGDSARPQLDSEMTRRSWAPPLFLAASCVPLSCCASRRSGLSAESRFEAERKGIIKWQREGGVYTFTHSFIVNPSCNSQLKKCST